MQDQGNWHVICFLPVIPQFQYSTKIVTDVWANQVLNALLPVAMPGIIADWTLCFSATAKSSDYFAKYKQIPASVSSSTGATMYNFV